MAGHVVAEIHGRAGRHRLRHVAPDIPPALIGRIELVNRAALFTNLKVTSCS